MPSTISSLLVDMQVNSAALRKGLDAAAGHVKTFGSKVSAIGESITAVAQKMEQFGKKSAMVGAALTGAVALALRSAAQHNAAVAREVEKVKGAFAQLAGEIAKAILPVVKEFSAAIMGVVGWVRSLSPATRESIVHWVRMGAEVLAVVAIAGKLASAIGLVARVASLVGALISSGIVLPLIAIAGIAAGVITIVGLLSEAWEQSTDATKETLLGIGETMKNVFLSVATAIGSVLAWIRDRFVDLLELLARGIYNLGKKFGDTQVGQNLMGQAQTVFDLIHDIQGGNLTEKLLKLGKDLGSTLAGGFKRGLEATGIAGLIDKAKNAFHGLTSGNGGDAALGGHVSQLQSYAIQNAAAAGALATGAVNANTFQVGGGKYAPNRISATSTSGNTASSIVANDRLANAAHYAAMAIANEFTPKLGKLGQLFDAAKGEIANGISKLVQSMGAGAGAGGVIGAVVGVLASLLGDSAGFMGIITIVDALVQTLADGLGGLIEPVQLVAASLMPLIKGLVAMVAPFWTVIGLVADLLIPPITALGMMLQAFAPIMNIFAGSLAVVFTTVTMTTVPALELLFEAFRLLGMGAISIGQWAGRWWNSVSEAIASIMDSIAKVSFDIGNAHFAPFAALGDFAKQLRGTHVSIAGLDQQMDDLQKLTWEGAQAQAENTRQTILGTQAMEKATAAFLNVPSGYRVALARFDAQGTGGGVALEGTASLPPMQVTFNVTTTDPNIMWTQFEQMVKDKEYVRRGRFGKKRI